MEQSNTSPSVERLIANRPVSYRSTGRTDRSVGPVWHTHTGTGTGHLKIGPVPSMDLAMHETDRRSIRHIIDLVSSASCFLVSIHR